MVGAWRTLHKILGLSVGALLLLVCLSGGILVFKENIIGLSVKNVEAEQKYNIDHLADGLGQIIADHALNDIYYIKTPTQGRDYWLLVTRDEQMFMYSAKTAEPILDQMGIQPALHWLSHFHTELLIAHVGTTLITLIGVFTLLLMVAGLISWWPGRGGFRWHHLWLLPKKGSWRRGPALRQHRALAVICLPLLLLSVVTGGGMSVQSALRYWMQPAKPVNAVQTTEVKPQPAVDLDVSHLKVLLKNAQRALPSSEITLIGLPNSQRNQLRLRFRTPDEWHINGKTNVVIAADSGEMQIKGIENITLGRKILNTFYPLHSSYGLPALYKALVALTGILAVWLACLGFIAWLKRRRGAAMPNVRVRGDF